MSAFYMFVMLANSTDGTRWLSWCFKISFQTPRCNLTSLFLVRIFTHSEFFCRILPFSSKLCDQHNRLYRVCP